MKGRIVKKIVAGMIALSMVLPDFTAVPAIAAAEQNDIVSFRTLDRDIMIGTTANSPFNGEDISKNMSLDSMLAGESYKLTTTDIDATDLSNWYVYDHYDTSAYATEKDWENQTGYNKNLRPYYYFTETQYGSNTAPIGVEEALERSAASTVGNVYRLKEHILASSDNGKAAMKFYGYGTTGCTDFLFYPAQETGTKKVEYTINAKDVKTHSLSQAGFLFNCGVVDGNLFGYAMAFKFKPGVVEAGMIENTVNASGIQSVSIYKIANMPIASMHEKSMYMDPNYSASKEYLTEIQKVDLSSIEFKDHFDVSNVKMEITENTLKIQMTEAGALTGEEPNVMALVEFQNLDAAGENYCEAYTPSGFGGFGPFVAYQEHACVYTSSYIYSDLKMSVVESDSVLSGLSNVDFTKKKVVDGGYAESDKYFILIGDNTEREDGYRDYFKRDFDDVYLEMLKKQGVTLITNLNIENLGQNINGTNYMLKDYLGESNVIQITGDTPEELAANIERAIMDSEYSRDEADQAWDALDEVTGTGHDHSAARCVLTYQNMQVDKVNISRVGTGSVELLIDESMSINVSRPVYTLRWPNGSTKKLEGNKVVIDGTRSWPEGEYFVTVSYAEGVSARTSFFVTSSYNSYFNGKGAPEGVESDHLSCLPNTVGVNQVQPGRTYKTGLLPEAGYSLPRNIVVKADSLRTGTTTDASGVVRDENGRVVDMRLLIAGTDYEYDPSTGVIEVNPDMLTGNIYIYANTSKVTYDLTNMTAGENPVTSVSSYDGTDLVAELTPVPAVLRMPDSVTVALGESEYKVTQGVAKTVRNGKISYKSGKVSISSQLLTEDITIRASTGESQVFYRSNIDCIAQGGQTADVLYGQDYDNILKLEDGFVISSATAALGQDMDTEGKPLNKPESFSFDIETGAVHIDGDDLVDDIYIDIKVEPEKYTVTNQVEHTELEGDPYCMADVDYTARLTVGQGYEMPEQISVIIGGQEAEPGNYEYDRESGDIWIDGGVIKGDVVIQGENAKKAYEVTPIVKHLVFDGDSECDMLQDYGAVIRQVQGYALPETVSVEVAGQQLSPDAYSYDSATGKILIPKEQITNHIVIRAQGVKKVFKVTPVMENLEFDGARTCDVSEDYQAVIRAMRGYGLSESIDVTIGGEQTDDYQYDPNTGEVAISKNAIRGDVVIAATGRVKDYPVHAEVKNLSFEGDSKGNIKNEYTGELSPEPGYRLPDSISVKVGEDPLAREDYSYDAITGKVVIPKGKIMDDVLIQAAAAEVKQAPKEYQVSYRLTNLTVNGSNKAVQGSDYVATLIPDANYNLPASFTVSAGGKILQPGVDYGYDGTTGVLTIPSQSVVGDIIVEAAGTAVVKMKQSKPDVSKLTIIPPKYENSFDGRVIGVTTDMEYSVDGGKTWIPCKTFQIAGLGVGTIAIRFSATGDKDSSPIAKIELDSATMEYYIPTVSMSKRMGKRMKFRLKIKNTKGAAVKVSTSNPSIVKVNKKGLIRSGKKAGKAKVVVTIIKGRHIVQYVANITVSKKVKKNYSLRKFRTNYKEPAIALYKKLKKGRKWKVKMTHTKQAKISFRSSNKSVATVSKSGRVRGKRAGNARITITVANGGVIDQYYVIVRVFEKGKKADLSFLKEIK